MVPHAPSTLINHLRGDKQKRSILVDEAKKLDIFPISSFYQSLFATLYPMDGSVLDLSASL